MTSSSLRDRISQSMPRYSDLLSEFVAIDSVSQSTADPSRVDASAQWVAEQLGARGCDVEIYRTRTPEGSLGLPTVVGHYPGPEGSPHVVLYAHHDVMPGGDPAEWTTTEPFTARVIDGRLYGRGSADDGAGLVAHLATIDHLLIEGNGELPCSLTVLSEGEEEVGSASFESFLEQHGHLVDADVLVVADGGNPALGEPALTTSLRGVIQVFVTVSTMDHPVHSGMYGGVACDAVTAMCRLVASLHDEHGNVAIDGLRGAVHRQGTVKRDSFSCIDMSEDTVRADCGIRDDVPLLGQGSVTDRLWFQPSISVIGIDAVDVAHSSCTLQPQCRARLSLRTAPGENTRQAYEALVRHLHNHAPFGMHVEVECDELGAACLVDDQAPAVQVALDAMTEAWGHQAVTLGMGASIPFVALYQEKFPQAQILVTGIEDPDARAHGADESIHLGELERIIHSQCLLLNKLSA
ncbi:M20/M25/M40 family metallo-hydrolase [Actinomyces vulturis]|uniref:M20/M25/M40 family metallo-hydrolase n=1 Tax=Actinomyces vulturis TaxID=1857645 RepID=UPI0008324271|nr:M20/M25/M40 family metallo-hydrolase [Actinomyces vulturis]